MNKTLTNLCILFMLTLFLVGCKANPISNPIDESNNLQDTVDEPAKVDEEKEEEDAVTSFNPSENMIKVKYDPNINSTDLIIHGLYAHIVGDGVQLVLHYESELDRLFIIFDPPEGAILNERTEISKDEEVAYLDIPFSTLNNVNYMTISFHSEEDPERNMLYFPKQSISKILSDEHMKAFVEKEVEDYPYDGPKPVDYERGKIENLDYVRRLPGDSNGFDLRSYDLSDVDLSEVNLSQSRFDSNTIFPDVYAKENNISQIYDLGKNPGLNVRNLHSQGITGKGVNVAVIDERMLIRHHEFGERVVHYEEMIEMDGPAKHHGTPITSILAGKTVGIAPEAMIHYFAYSPAIYDVENIDNSVVQLTNAIQKILDMNKTLSPKDKIRVISISSGWADRPEASILHDKIKEAWDSGIFIITARLHETNELYYEGLQRNYHSNPDDLASYSMPIYDYFSYVTETKNILMAPMTSRTLASSSGIEDFTFYGDGGWSTLIPYISGLYALVCQIEPNITPQEFWNVALETGDVIKGNPNHNYFIVNPVKLIDHFK